VDGWNLTSRVRQRCGYLDRAYQKGPLHEAQEFRKLAVEVEGVRRSIVVSARAQGASWYVLGQALGVPAETLRRTYGDQAASVRPARVRPRAGGSAGQSRSSTYADVLAQVAALVSAPPLEP
jgi:hypothetical protein